MSKVSKKIKGLAALAAVLCFSVLAMGGGAMAKIGCIGANCANNGATEVAGEQEGNLTGTVGTIINVVIFVIGFVAVAMVILGGVQYSTSSGDSAKVKKAKDTIMYGIIGLVVAILAFAIVNFVLQGVFLEGE